ncbi:sugar porter family MFS transporter [Kozakia baliensis]|uniref:D-galactose transporter GalP n=1 Tax=Kozakia baliensis TaxID=153496 RepID=A0A1D8US55_9PROT|nr:sugar porter family MFS transporter [Kozakia baliensis]AOX16479.1 D-galactose transporter GalP [Kozakia baliensis]GBR29162.1 sugar-proton symporter [Kozakia baliensis NRIC 0488]GEL63433.1 galactose-proton symporter [Kozakia baliensis]
MVGVATSRSESDLSQDASTTTRATILGVVAALAGLMFGLDTGVVSGALPFIAQDFHTSARMQEWIVSSMMAGAAFGSLIAGSISTRFGRTGAMMGAAALFLLGTFVCTFAPSPAYLICGRVFLGLAVGVAAFAAPLYISEITVESARGAMISFYQLMVTLGIFLAFVSDGFFSHGGHWRWMLGVMTVPATLFMISVLFLPHSPRWLAMKQREGQALKVLRLLRSDEEVAQAELASIEARLNRDTGAGWNLFRREPNFRRSVMLGIILQVMQQLTGINVLMYYAPRVFQAAHFGTSAAVWATTLVGLINMAATGVAIVFVDRWGRRPLLMLSCAIAAISMAGVGILLAIGGDSLGIQIGLVGFVLLFVAGFAIGEGPLVWTLCSEVQPTRGRDFGIGCSTVTNWAANWLISNTFLTLMATLGSSGTFLLFAAFNALFIVITLTFVPETRDVSLEAIETNLFAGKRLRDLGR